ncbi:MAG: hypothetical protein E7F47_01905 [Peptoniphilus harei]|nr:hypothetical protein [Peptoniphilus harei]
MKYKELERIAVKAEWTITDKPTLYYIEKEYEEYKNKIIIGKIKRKSIYIDNDVCMPQEDFEVIKAAIELAETPPEEREDEKKYYLRHKLLYGGSVNYLNFDNSTKWWKLNNKSQNDYTQTQFTQEEIDGIKKGYDVDLKDFEIIEVEE